MTSGSPAAGFESDLLQMGQCHWSITSLFILQLTLCCSNEPHSLSFQRRWRLTFLCACHHYVKVTSGTSILSLYISNSLTLSVMLVMPSRLQGNHGRGCCHMGSGTDEMHRNTTWEQQKPVTGEEREGGRWGGKWGERSADEERLLDGKSVP